MASTAGGIKAGKAFVVIEAIDRTATAIASVGKRLDRFASKLKSIGQSLVVKGVAGLGAFGFGIKEFADFDSAMKRIQARGVTTIAGMAAITEQTKKLGRESAFTQVALGELAVELKRKGFTEAEILPTQRLIPDLARAGGGGLATINEDLLKATILLTEVQNTMFDKNRTEKQGIKITTAFANAISASALGFDDLIEAMQKAAPIAKVYGFSLEDLVTLLGVMADVGIKGAESGTAVRNMFINTGEKLEEFNKELAVFGKQIIFKNAEDNLKPLSTILFAIGKATEDLGTVPKGQLFNLLFGKRALTPAIGVSRIPQAFNKLRTEIGEGNKTAKIMADIIDSGIGGALIRVSSAFKGFKLAIGEALAKTITGGSLDLAKLLNKMAEWVEENRRTIGIVFQTVAAITALGVAFVLAGHLIGLAATAIALLSALFTPMGAAIATFVGIMGLLVKESGISFSQIRSDFKSILDAVMIGEFTLAWEIMLASMEKAWEDSFGNMIRVMKELIKLQKESFKLVEDVLPKFPKGKEGGLENAINKATSAALDNPTASINPLVALINLAFGKSKIADAVKEEVAKVASKGIDAVVKEVAEAQDRVDADPNDPRAKAAAALAAKKQELINLQTDRLIEQMMADNAAKKSREELAKKAEQKAADLQQAIADAIKPAGKKGGTTQQAILGAFQKGAVGTMQRFLENQNRQLGDGKELDKERNELIKETNENLSILRAGDKLIAI